MVASFSAIVSVPSLCRGGLCRVFACECVCVCVFMCMKAHATLQCLQEFIHVCRDLPPRVKPK